MSALPGLLDNAERAILLHRLSKLYSNLAAAELKCGASGAARMRLPAGSKRSKVTTANARWSTACEARDRIEKAIRELRAADGSLP